MSLRDRFLINISAVGICVLAALGSPARGADRGETKATIGKATVTIDYGRPFLKGRDPIAMLKPGQVWRIGANAPTTLESNVDLDIGGTRVPKGKHILLARVIEPGKWSLVVSTKSAFQYESSAKLAEAPMDLQEAKDPVEQLSIELSEKSGRGIIEIAWGTLRLLASFTPAK
jgi:hypothetical protein